MICILFTLAYKPWTHATSESWYLKGLKLSKNFVSWTLIRIRWVHESKIWGVALLCSGGSRGGLPLFCASVNSSCILPPPPPPFPATAGHLPTLWVPGVGHLPTLRHLSSFQQACGFLSKYNWTWWILLETQADEHGMRTGKTFRDFMHAFLHCFSSQNLLSKIKCYRHESMYCMFWLLNQIFVDPGFQ